MRKKGKRKRIFGRTSILYITSIFTLSILGVGYAAWNDGLNINMGITTGDTDFYPEISNDNRELQVSLSTDNRSIYISGEVYPSFNEDVSIKIIDKGSIPLKLDSVDSNISSDVTELNKHNKDKNIMGRPSSSSDDAVETFLLNINPVENENENSMMRKSSLSIQEIYLEADEYQNEINNLRKEIKDIQDEIDRLNVIERHNFKYNLRFIQGI